MEQTLFLIAITCSILFLFQTILMLFGLDHHIDFDIDVHGDLPIKVLSIQSVLVFGMLFGWLTLAFNREWHYSAGKSLALAGLLGFIGMTLMATIMHKLRKLDHSPLTLLDVPVEKVRGMTAETYLPVNDSSGMIRLRGQVFKARSPEPIPSFTNVYVVDREDDVFTVKKIEANNA